MDLLIDNSIMQMYYLFLEALEAKLQHKYNLRPRRKGNGQSQTHPPTMRKDIPKEAPPIATPLLLEP